MKKDVKKPKTVKQKPHLVIGITVLILVFLVTTNLLVNQNSKKQVSSSQLAPTIALSEGIYFEGIISPRVPYEGLKFREINVHNFKPLLASLDKSDYHKGEYVYDGYTFVASKGENFEFIAKEDRSSNPGSFIHTELYGWGPTVIKMDTTIGWGVPATTRYFYVVVGRDGYGPGFVVPDGSGRTYDGSKYGNYTLIITQRK